jgi:two-component system, OmpR family, KDP operon response regulator KdpE
MSGRHRILVVDDERPIRRLLHTSLTAEGYEVIEAETAAQGLAMAAREKPDAVLLDLGLPDQDGIDALRQLREWSTVPVVVVTVRADETQKVAALDSGADDYVTKPFGMGELLARLRTALRHGTQAEVGAPVFVSGKLSVDLAKRRVALDGEEVKLSPKEYDLLRLFVRHAGRVLTHQMILKEIWGPAHADDTQYLRVYVGQLRQKLQDDPTEPALIRTEPGVGYRFAEADSTKKAD